MSDTASVKILRSHYEEYDYTSSIEGILKVLSVIACIIAGVSWLAGAGGRAAGCGAAGAGAALASAAALALLAAAPLTSLPARAPYLWLYTDATVCGAAGVLLLLAAALDAAFCRAAAGSPLTYFYLTASAAAAGAAVGSAALGFARATRRLDAARARAQPPPRAPPADLDV